MQDADKEEFPRLHFEMRSGEFAGEAYCRCLVF
jgi:hypothetical protein